ncbi:MAG: winged helix-turn-helix domain-containing protein [Oscillochloridaceae bacterium umkhey_bin13]
MEARRASRFEVLVVAPTALPGLGLLALPLVARRIIPATDLGELLTRIWEWPADLIIITAGFAPEAIAQACVQVRRFFQTPILILAETADEAERIIWLDHGADDILTRPYLSDAELVARCHALRRRCQRQVRRDPTALRLHVAGLQLDPLARRLYPAHGPPLDLSVAQTRLMALLLSYDDQVVPLTVLRQHMDPQFSISVTRRIETLIRGLNHQLLNHPARPPLIMRVRGNGYRLGFHKPPAE